MDRRYRFPRDRDALTQSDHFGCTSPNQGCNRVLSTHLFSVSAVTGCKDLIAKA